MNAQECRSTLTNRLSPPGPGARTLGGLVPMFRDPIKSFTWLAKKYGDISYFRVGRNRFYFLNSPEYIYDALVKDHKNLIKGKYLQNTKRVFGEGLLTSEGEFHHRQRRLIQPAFYHEQISSYANVMTSYASRQIDTWKNGETLDIHGEMNRLTMTIVAKCLFDADIEIESRGIGIALADTIEYFNRLSSPLAPLLEVLPLPSTKKYRRSVEKLDRMVYRLIEEKRNDRADRPDLLSGLLNARDAEGKMTDEQVRDEILILFAAGHETTANALTWTWYLLSQNLEVEEKFHTEIDLLLKENELPSPEDLPKLSYATKVLTESMRIYPPAWVLVRETLNDYNIGKYFIRKGSNLLMSQYIMHRNPRYFPRPEKFIPDRWTPEFKVSLPKYAYFPFGGGPRGCIGEPFAWMEGVLVLATIARRWEFRHVADHKVELLPRITLRPKHGIKMKVIRR